MAVRILGPARSRRRRRFLIVPILLVTAAALMWIGGAAAVHDTGAFELDGNATNDPAVLGDDWDNVCHQVLATDCSTTSDTNGATAVDWVVGAEPERHDLHRRRLQGPAGRQPVGLEGRRGRAARQGQPAAQLRGAVLRRAEGEVLFFGSDRFDNSGDAQQGFWFFQNSIGLGNNSVGGGTGFTGVHKNGDVLVVTDFSNGGATSTITVYAWDPTCTKTTGSTVGTCGDANLRIKGDVDQRQLRQRSANDQFCGIVNPTNGTTAPWPFTDKSGNTTYLQGEFFEGGVNLTALGLGDKCFSSVASESRASTSTTATLKDFVLGGFGTCGSAVTSQRASAAGRPRSAPGRSPAMTPRPSRSPASAPGAARPVLRARPDRCTQRGDDDHRRPGRGEQHARRPSRRITPPSPRPATTAGRRTSPRTRPESRTETTTVRTSASPSPR